MTKYDGKCLHGASPGSPGDCEELRKEDSCLCEYHHELCVRGEEKAPPLRLVYDYVSQPRKSLLVYEDYTDLSEKKSDS